MGKVKEADCMYKRFVNSSGRDIAETLDASYYKGQGFRQGAEREYIVVISECDGKFNGKRIQQVGNAGSNERHVCDIQ